MQKSCVICNSKFTTNFKRVKTCSKVCKKTHVQRYHKLPRFGKKICAICKKEFLPIAITVRVCSGECRKKSISKTMTGRPPNFIAYGEKHPMWKGGRQKSANGYIVLTLASYSNTRSRNRIFEHRYLMEKKLNRPLDEEEVVHHINHIRDDNRIENLMLFKNHSEHMKYERSASSR